MVAAAARPHLVKCPCRSPKYSYPSSSHPMRIVLNVVGVLSIVMGCVWFLQGINILPGSFMTGQTKWAVYGGLLVVAGIGVLIAVNRRRV
jgi:hypothetical protein